MVRIAPTPALMSDNPRALDPEKPRGLSAAAPSERSAEEGIWGQTRLSTSGSASQKIESDPTFLAFDSRYYLAQELDSYPRPLAPLHFSRPAGGSAVEVLLEVLVDERGVVQDVILAQSSQSGRADEELRALLAAAHFLPARRDGRAVKSRLVLRVRVDREDGER